MNIPLNIDWQQILLHLLNFAILAGGLYFLLYRPVQQFMEKRTAHYQVLEDAVKQKTLESERLNAQYTGQLRQAEDEIRQKKAQAQQSIQNAIQIQLAEANEQAEQIIAAAQKAAVRCREKAVQDAQEDVRKLAVTATEKLVLQSEGDAFDQFLTAAERGSGHEQSKH